jgi:DNA-binding LacI/PurR family transcriptional regulator
MKAGYSMANRFLASGVKATAVFCMADEMAYGVMRAFHDAGIRMPDQMGVVGFDGHPASAFTEPPLTTVQQPLARMGRRAAEMVFAAIQSKTPHAGREVFTTELIVRASAGTLRQA